MILLSFNGVESLRGTEVNKSPGGQGRKRRIDVASPLRHRAGVHVGKTSGLWRRWDRNSQGCIAFVTGRHRARRSVRHLCNVRRHNPW